MIEIRICGSRRTAPNRRHASKLTGHDPRDFILSPPLSVPFRPSSLFLLFFSLDPDCGGTQGKLRGGELRPTGERRAGRGGAAGRRRRGTAVRRQDPLSFSIHRSLPPSLSGGMVRVAGRRRVRPDAAARYPSKCFFSFTFVAKKFYKFFHLDFFGFGYNFLLP